MFRRKEESLFDNEFNAEEADSFNVVQAPAANAPAAPAASAAPATMVAASTASSQPITRPASPVTAPATPSAGAPVSSLTGYRPTAQNTAPVNNPISRPTESKAMNTLAQSAKVNSRILTVGNDILLKGEITTCDRLVIEGKVEATISDVNTVELAECGSFKGSANVVDAQISGLFEGDLIVTGRLVIYASGKVRGNITYGEIEIERGGELSGQIKNAGTSQSAPKALRKEAA